jgi:Protein phosphatase 2C
MKLNYRVMFVQKAGSTIEQYEDAYEYSADPAIAAISDGAGSAFESGRWARLLAETFVKWPPSGEDRLEVLDWVGRASAAWHASIPWQALSFFEEEKAKSQGSAATLVGLRLEEARSGTQYGKWRCMAMGDSCLFRVADGSLATAIPLHRSAEFGKRPSLFYTQRDMSERDIPRLVTAQGTWCDGDSFFLLTDAIAEWFLREVEQGGRPWEALAAQDDRSFGSFVEEQRDRRLMRNDDVTVMSLDILAARQAVRPREPVGAQVHPGSATAQAPVPPALFPASSSASLAPFPDPPEGPPIPPQRRPAQPGGLPARAAQGLRDRPRLLLVIALCLCLLAGFAIGWAAHGTRVATVVVTAPSPKPSPTGSPPPQPGTAVDSEARAFLTALVNYHGDDLAGYESSLASLSTRGFDAELARILGLKPRASSAADSQGQVISATLTSLKSSAAELYAVVRQTVRYPRASQDRTQVLLIRLSMVRSATNWQADGIEFLKPVGPIVPGLTTPHSAGKLPASGSTNKGKP